MPAGFRAPSKCLDRVMNKAEAVPTLSEGAESEMWKQMLSKYSHTHIRNDKLRYTLRRKSTGCFGRG